MGVQLNIKDQKVVTAARELAKDLGKSVTDTIGEAIEEKRQRTAAERERVFQEAMKIIEQAAAMWPERTRGMTARELVNELYDENGLPK